MAARIPTTDFVRVFVGLREALRHALDLGIGDRSELCTLTERIRDTNDSGSTTTLTGALAMDTPMRFRRSGRPPS